MDHLDDNKYEVEEILDRRSKKRTKNLKKQYEYLVKWVGYEDPTWEPEENLSCAALLFEFDAKRAWKNRMVAVQTTDADELIDINEH